MSENPTVVVPSNKTLEEIDFQLQILSRLQKSASGLQRDKIKKKINYWLDQRLVVKNGL